jgi:hypothetical protein
VKPPTFFVDLNLFFNILLCWSLLSFCHFSFRHCVVCFLTDDVQHKAHIATWSFWRNNNCHARNKKERLWSTNWRFVLLENKLHNDEKKNDKKTTMINTKEYWRKDLNPQKMLVVSPGANRTNRQLVDHSLSFLFRAWQLLLRQKDHVAIWALCWTSYMKTYM